MAWLSTLVLVLAVSLDSLGVGFAYGLKKLAVPPVSLVLLSSVSALGMLISMLAGRGAGLLLGERGHLVGSSMLILMGFFSFRRVRQSERRRMHCRLRPEQMTTLEMVIRVAEEPMEADLDSSGEIGGAEALLLGIALAIDSLGAGFGAALAAFSPATTSLLAGVLTWRTLNLGLYIGRRVKLAQGSWVDLVPGVLLILLGGWRLL